jgi:hypothetical protein
LSQSNYFSGPAAFRPIFRRLDHPPRSAAAAHNDKLKRPLPVLLFSSASPALHDMPRNHNAGTSTLRNRNRVTNKTRLKIFHGSIDDDSLAFEETPRLGLFADAQGVDAEDANV